MSKQILHVAIGAVLLCALLVVAFKLPNACDYSEPKQKHAFAMPC